MESAKDKHRFKQGNDDIGKVHVQDSTTTRSSQEKEEVLAGRAIEDCFPVIMGPLLDGVVAPRATAD